MYQRQALRVALVTFAVALVTVAAVSAVVVGTSRSSSPLLVIVNCLKVSCFYLL